jgi:hypothetical protein
MHEERPDGKFGCRAFCQFVLSAHRHIKVIEATIGHKKREWQIQEWLHAEITGRVELWAKTAQDAIDGLWEILRQRGAQARAIWRPTSAQAIQSCRRLVQEHLAGAGERSRQSCSQLLPASGRTCP